MENSVDLEELLTSVTICNYNMLRYSQIESGSEIDMLLQKELNKTTVFDQYYLMDSIISSLGSLSDAQKKPLGHQLEDMVVECYFNGIECNLTMDFEFFFNSYLGNCYTYNSIKKPVATMSYVLRGGSTFGLYMLLNIENDEYIETLTDTAGIVLLVHNQTDMPFPDDSGQLLPVGSLSNVIIRKSLFNKYTDCKKEDSLDLPNAYSKPYSVMYSKDACSWTCVQKNIVANCGCYSPDTPYHSDLFPEVKATNHSCVYGKQEWNCLHDQWVAYQDGKIDCHECVSGCQSAFFDAQITSAPWPRASSLENIKNALSNSFPELFTKLEDGSGTLSMEAVQDNLLQVAIYFDRLSVLTITESLKYELYQFISDLGGAFGLWIGFSFLTFVEIWEFAMDLLVYCCYEYGGRKRATSVRAMQTDNFTCDQ